MENFIFCAVYQTIKKLTQSRCRCVFTLLIYGLGQLECFLPQCYMKNDCNQFIYIKMIYDDLESEISDVAHEIHAITCCYASHVIQI